MSTVLATVAAGALIIGSAAGAMAAPKDKPAPQTTVKLQSVSIKGHKTIDLANPATLTATVPLRAKVWDPKKANGASSVEVTLGVFTKKVNGELVTGAPASNTATLVLRPGDQDKKVKRYSLVPKLVGDDPADLWTAAEVTALATILKPGDKAYICIATADVTLVDEARSMQTRKRLDIDVKKPVRDCVKVVDSTP